MIDLHCHLLPGIDDGAPDLQTALDMARAFVDQGVEGVACTPHILPGLYHNTGPQIVAAVAAFREQLANAGIPLVVVAGADNHIIPDFVQGLRSGHLLPISNTRYVLVEPPHHIAPTRLDELFFDILVAGYIPILTHPERLTWVEGKYDLIESLASRGVWMQLTTGSLIGLFGTRARKLSERMLRDGMVQIIATDAHDLKARPPNLVSGQKAAAQIVGAAEAHRLVVTRPAAVLLDWPPSDIAKPGVGADVAAGPSVDRKRQEAHATETTDGAGADGGNRGGRSLWRLFG